MQRSFFFSQRFLPLFFVQFLGAFNDNVFKNALVMLITFQLAKTPSEAGFLITLAAGIFILPFFLFSAFAGQLADAYEKSNLIRKIKLAEVLIMLTGAVAFIMQDLVLLFGVLFLMGAQSAFFGPIKYAILPEHLAPDELLEGNGWFSASTFIAILLGTLVGGIVILSNGGIKWLSVLVVLIAVLGFVASLKVPSSLLREEKIRLDLNFMRSTWQEVAHSHQFPQAFFAVIAISWFWFLGATYLSQIPVFVKETLGGSDQAVVLFLTVFSVGIAIGAGIVSQMKVRVRRIDDTRWLVFLLLGISLAMLLSNALMQHSVQAVSAMSIAQFIHYPVLDLVLGLMGVIAILGGMYIVPLYTLLQVQTPDGKRSRMVAVNNIMNAIFMVSSSVLIMLLYALDVSLVSILAWIALLNVVMAAGFFKRAQKLAKYSGIEGLGK